METRLYEFYYKDGLTLNVIAPVDIEFPSFSLEYYNTISKCGAGSGWGDKLIPETILGIRVTLACYIHDYMWALSEPTWADFHHSNSVFLTNMKIITDALSWDSSFNVLRPVRHGIAANVFGAVSTVGAPIFWKMKLSN